MANIDEELQERSDQDFNAEQEPEVDLQEIDEENRRQRALQIYQQQQRQQLARRNAAQSQDTVQKAKKAYNWGKRLMWAGEFIAATFPIWGPIALVLFIALTFVGGCNGSSSFRIASLGACEPFIISGSTDTAIDRAPRSGGGGGGASFGDETSNRAALAAYGIIVNKACVDPTKQVSQTCIGGMTQVTLNEIIKIAQACDGQGPDPRSNSCGVLVTGGNELGHEGGPCSHTSGNKFDLSPTAALNSYITNLSLFTRIGTRSDGAPLYRQNSDGVVFADERNLANVGAHWDIGGVGCA